MSAIPLKPARLASYFLTFAFGIIGMGVGINAFVQSNHQKNLVKENAPPGATVTIDTDDVLHSGIVVTVICGLIALVSAIAFPILFLSRGHSGRALASRTLPLQGGLLTFLSIWLFATLVPFTDFVANRQAKVTAMIGTVALPASIVQAAESALGITPIYNKVNYLRIAAILPWFTLLFSIISAILAFSAWRTVRRTTSSSTHRGVVDRDEGEKAQIQQREKAPEVSEAAV